MNDRIDVSEEPVLRYCVVSESLLMQMLRRVENGEKADLVYIEVWANADRTENES